MATVDRDRSLVVMAAGPRACSRGQSEALLKGRVAEALVEAIFRRARYVVSRAGRESQFPSLLKAGQDGFLPDFLIRRPVEREAGQRPLHQLIALEVKYRRDLDTYLRQDLAALCEKAAGWPDLCAIFVTDNPAPGRSCFQVIDLRGDPTFTTRDLQHVPELDIYERTVRDFEHLVRQIFPLLGGTPLIERTVSEGSR